MGSHFSAIGLPASFGQTDLERIMPLANEIPTTDPSVVLLSYDDESGSRVTITLRDRVVTCLTPTFRPGGRMEAKFNRLADDECPYEMPALMGVYEDGMMVYPLAVQIDDLAVSRDRLVPDRREVFEIAALAETVTFFAGEAAHRDSGTPMAMRSLIPSGTFALPGDPDGANFQVTPRALMSGEVVASRMLRHSLFGVEFARLSIASYGGTYEAAVGVGDLPHEDGSVVLPPAGSVVKGQFWLSGRMIER